MKQKSILITGGTGFLGQALVADWLLQGHQLTILSRDPAAAALKFNNQVQTVSALSSLPKEAYFDAVINLAGAPIFAGRWSESRKQLLRDSRIAFSQRLVDYLATLPIKPEVLLSGSAIGVYGDQGDTQLTETSRSHEADFPQSLCVDWETTATQAASLGIRVCLLRTGLVLALGGGMLQNMLPAFRLGFGGRLGNGQQWMSWIHRRDWAASVNFLLNHPTLAGAFNLTAPKPVTNQSFSTVLAKQLHRPLLLPLSTGVIKLLFGEMASLMLGSQRVLPARLQAAGFEFQFNDLEAAMQQILQAAKGDLSASVDS
jgi:uncharacterized protein (TIGR01777 family)